MQAAARVNELTKSPEQRSLAQQHAALVAKIVDDADRGALKILYLYYGPRIKSVLLKAGADHAQAEDIVQVSMMTLWRKAHLFAPEKGSISAWIFTIARNARIDRLRRGSSQPYEDIDELELVSDAPLADDTLYADQRAELVQAALKELPDDQRRIIELAFMKDNSQREIAQELSVPLGTVKSRMRLAYEKLKVKLEELNNG